MSFTMHGVGVSRGIVIGRVHLLERNQLEVTEYAIPREQVNTEILRLQNAITAARLQLRTVREHIPRGAAADVAAFIDTHLMMLEDSSLTQEPVRLIAELRCNAEWALKLQRDALVAVFDEMEDPYLRSRRDDVDHVVNRIQRILLNHGPLRHETPDERLKDCIILSDDLTPADTVLLQHHGIAAFITEYGGPTSHTAILARSLGIPAIVGLHQARRYIRDEEQVVVDGTQGVVVVDPDDALLAYYREGQEQERRYFAELIKLKEAPAITADGVAVELHANIELPSDFEAVRRVGAKGVGLYRTEYLFMNREAPPDEAEQYENYREMISQLNGIPVTIRTLDLGADKAVNGGNQDRPLAANPALGLRAVRLCLKDAALFRPQLRAILRASASGPVRLLIPMLSMVQEVEQVLGMLREIREEFDRHGVAHDRNMPVGGMIEVPAAAVCADVFARQLDFLSIGTNDLIQYTMAIDRVNDEVNYLYEPLHPGVLRLIRATIQAGEQYGKPVGLCGEMASDPRYVRLLLALGLREFSVHPAALLEVKHIIQQTNLKSLAGLSARVLGCATGAEIAALLNDINSPPVVSGVAA
ncbi:MAG TPA: phosphoenolpyruvate--protein phosphotransferase [Gammaproteobacteria bacterium]|nr:phosphoenolpyruvate--protein phosphotransferase [Gammaproteobacteria bacterium]